MTTYTISVTSANGLVCYAMLAAATAPAIGDTITVHGHAGAIVGTVSAILETTQ